jgi:hypothetical protein
MATASAVAVSVSGTASVLAQQERPFELGANVTTLHLGEFETTDVGVGVQAAWKLSPVFAIDGALSLFPGGDNDLTASIDEQRRVLGLIGMRAGVRRGAAELFARVRPGFLTFVGQDNVACILIFPPPLSCLVLAGYTAFVTDIGGGARVDVGDRMQVTIDVGDLLVRYNPEPFRSNGNSGVISGSLVSHSLLFSAGLNWRF